jgi:hypothetical protein
MVLQHVPDYLSTRMQWISVTSPNNSIIQNNINLQMYKSLHPVVYLFLRRKSFFLLRNRAPDVLQSASVRRRYLAGITVWNIAEHNLSV